MTLERKINGRAATMNKVYQALANDEHMLRLLAYPYLDSNGNYQDCLKLPDNIVDSSTHPKVTSEHIIRTAKLDEIETIQSCMLFLHQGKRKPVFGNKLLAKQEILVDVLVHNNFQEGDYRMDDICDRLDYLLVHENISMGKVDITTPIPMEAPKEYYRYQMKYNYWDLKK